MTEQPGTWLDRQARNSPGKPALITSGAKTNYTQLYTQVKQLASYYLEHSLDPAQPFAVISRSREAIIRLSGLALYIGCPILPLAPDQTEIENILADAGIRQVLADDGVILPDSFRRLDITLHEIGTLPQADVSRACPPAPGFQLLIATSGTTGIPKVAVLAPPNISASVRASRQRLRPGPNDTWLNCLPVTHVGGFMIFLRCLEAGAAMHLLEAFDREQISDAVLNNQFTHISLVPAMLAQLLDAGVEIPPDNRLRVALTGGGPLDGQLATRAIEAGWPVCTAYGMTETTSHVCLNTDIYRDRVHTDAGTPLRGVQIEIDRTRDDYAGREGQIRIRGPMVMSGYLRNGRLDRSPVVNGFLSSDLGYLDSSGHLHVTGRVDDMLVSGGTNIHPAKVEQLMQQCPGVREIGITSVPDAVWGDRLVACVAADSSLRQIERWCREHLPGHLRPRAFRIIESLPRHPTGKLDRDLLQQCALDSANDKPE